MTPAPDLAAAVARLETENRNLLARVKDLEKRRSSSIPAVIANILLLLTAACLAGYLGFFPRPVERLPLVARTVEADEVVFRRPEGAGRARLLVSAKGDLRLLDENGKVLYPNP